jgi:translation initiation factor IF-2
VVESEARAREITEYRQRKSAREGGCPPGTGARFAGADDERSSGRGNSPSSRLVIKADVQGSVEAIAGA